jgi:hypothetical protein
MANRYWVGGAGIWNTTATTHWSATSGGASGASVPTAADSVFFDQAATYTVTCTGALTCLDFTVSAGTVTFTDGTTPTFAISGSMSLVAATVWNSVVVVTFNATSTGKTITTNGVVFNGTVIFNGVGGGWTLGSAFNPASVTFTNGTFSTGNFALSSQLHITNSGTGTNSVSLGSSAVTVVTNWEFSNTTGLTFNAGTSTISLAVNRTFNGGGLTYSTLSAPSLGSGSLTINGANTFTNFSASGATGGTLLNISFSADQTVTGTLTATGTSTNNRLFLRSSAIGTPRTFTVAAISLSNVDFRDITAAGAAGTWSGTSFGDCGGNTNITFPAAKTVYWNLAGAQNWSATGWATSSGGAPAAANFPLPQDTAVFDNTGSVTGTITINRAWNLGTVNMSARTTAMTFSTGSVPIVYGSWFNGSGVTPSGTGDITFSGRTTQQLTSAGKTFTQSIAVDNLSGIVQCNDALTLDVTRSLTIYSGTLKLFAGVTSTVGSFATSGTTLKYLQSTTAGTQATISDASGTNSVTYLYIKDSNATGGATWSASGTGNVNAGNNTGWTGLPASTTGNFFFMFN